MAPGHLDAVQAMVRDGGYTKVRHILEGAETRNDTTPPGARRARRRGLQGAAARRGPPAAQPAHRHRLLRARSTTTTPSTWRSRRPTRSSRSATTTRSRRSRRGPALRRGQTPQGFRLSVIQEAYATAAPDPDFEATDDCSVVLRYLPDVPDLGGRRRGAEHEGHRADRRLPRRQALPADRATCRPDARRRGTTARRWPARRWSSSAAATASAPTSPSWRRVVRRRRRDVQPLEHQHPRRAPRATSRRAAARRRWSAHGSIDFVVNTAGVLPRGDARRDLGGDDLRRHRDQLPRADPHRPGVLPAPARRPGAACCSSPPAPTRAGAAATASTPRRRRRW